MKADCRVRLASKQKKQGRFQQKAHVVEHFEQKESAFYVFMAKRTADPVNSSTRYIDLRASRHFTHRWDWFTKYEPFTDSVIFGGGKEHTVAGKGNVQVHSGGRNLIFLDVYYVPGMEHNLLSVSQIMRHSPQLDVVFSSSNCSIVDRETRIPIAMGLEDHGLFRLADSGDSQEHALAARNNSINKLWHQRYGHLNVLSLSTISGGFGCWST